MGVGIQLKKILREKHITIKKLSEISGVSLNSLYSITKRDSSHVSIGLLQKISSALDVPMSDLLDEVDKSKFEKLDNYKDLVNHIKNEIIDDPEFAKQFREHEKTSEFAARLIYIGFEESAKESLIDSFLELNALGQKEALKRIIELTKIPEYQKKEEE